MDEPAAGILLRARNHLMHLAGDLARRDRIAGTE
jgi:hypothetical protein